MLEALYPGRATPLTSLPAPRYFGSMNGQTRPPIGDEMSLGSYCGQPGSRRVVSPLVSGMPAAQDGNPRRLTDAAP